MKKRFTSFAGALARDERGLGLIEIAALAPFLALLAVGVIDITSAVTKRVKIQYAVSRTIELAAAHGLQQASNSNSYDFTFYKEHAATAAGIDSSQVQTDYWLECGDTGVRQPAATNLCPVGQPSARYLKIVANSSFTPIFSIRALGGAIGSTYPIVTEAAVRLQ